MLKKIDPWLKNRPGRTAVTVAVAATIVASIHPWSNAITYAAVLTAAFTGAYFLLTWSLVRSQQDVIRNAKLQIDVMEKQVSEAQQARVSAEAQAERAAEESRRQAGETRQHAEDAARRADVSLRESIRGRIDAVGSIAAIALDRDGPELMVRKAYEFPAGSKVDREVLDLLSDGTAHPINVLKGVYVEWPLAQSLWVTAELRFLVRNVGPVPFLLMSGEVFPGDLHIERSVGGHILLAPDEWTMVRWTDTRNLWDWVKPPEPNSESTDDRSDIPTGWIRVEFTVADTSNLTRDTYQWTGDIRFAEVNGSITEVVDVNRVALGYAGALRSDRTYLYPADGG